jgi:GWxTD domain-containing protein
MKRKKISLIIIVFIWGLPLLFSNITFAKKMRLSKANARFLSEVRYIITKDERRYFRYLPEGKREEFIEMFWESRDPLPETAENEFKVEYYRRIEEANRKFTSAREGWLTDRGKTYILLGPPRHISDHPTGAMGEYAFTRPFVVWHYPEVFLLFEQNKNDGDYEVQYVSMFHHSQVQKAFAEAKSRFKVMEDLFQYDFKYKKIESVPHLIFSIDLTKLNFKEEANRMVSNLEISITVRDKAYKEVWTYLKVHPITFDLDFLKSKEDKGYQVPNRTVIKIPMKVPKGRYLVFSSIKRMDDFHRSFQNKLLKIK